MVYHSSSGTPAPTSCRSGGAGARMWRSCTSARCCPRTWRRRCGWGAAAAPTSRRCAPVSRSPRRADRVPGGRFPSPPPSSPLRAPFARSLPVDLSSVVYVRFRVRFGGTVCLSLPEPDRLVCVRCWRCGGLGRRRAAARSPYGALPQRRASDLLRTAQPFS